MALRNYAQVAPITSPALPDVASESLWESAASTTPPALPDVASESPWESAAPVNPALPVESASHLPEVVPNTKGFEDAGFAGFKLDFTSFPTISLKNEGRFEDTDGHVYGSSLEALLLSSRERYVYRAVTGTEVEDNRKDTGFSYDKITFTNGVSVAQQVALWESQGKKVEIRDYLEVQCILHGGEMDGEWRLLSIPRLSIGRFWGFFTQLFRATNGNPSSTPVRIYVGEKVTKARQPWYPWAFSTLRK